MLGQIAPPSFAVFFHPTPPPPAPLHHSRGRFNLQLRIWNAWTYMRILAFHILLGKRHLFPASLPPAAGLEYRGFSVSYAPLLIIVY
jgi:hypothetical protein